MAILSNTGFYGFLSSCKKEADKFVSTFVSGFSGSGWKIWERTKGKYQLQIDEIMVRGTMTVFELLISKIRAIKGALAITQGSGKIKEITDRGTYYEVTLEEEDMSFVTDDLIRCQSFTGSGVRGYHVPVRVEGSLILMDKSGFDQDEAGEVLYPPEPGDEIVQFGNISNTNRQAAIYLHADETGQPAIDVMFGIDSTDWTDRVKVRLGGDLPGTEGAKGLYCENGMIKATDESGTVIYSLSPDGSVNLGKGKIRYDPKTDKLTFGEGVTLTWDNLSQDTQENLKGEQGEQGEKGDSGEPGKDGIDGSSAYVIDLTNENASVPCDYEGNVTGSIPSTKAVVYKGSVVDTGWMFSAVFTGCRGAYGSLTGTVSVTVLSEDTATVVITATKSGYANLTATYSLSKVRAGAPGEDAVVYWLEPSVSVIQKDKNGTLIPSSVSCVKMKQIGGEAAVETSEKTLKFQLSNGTEKSYTGEVAVGSAGWLDFILYDGTTVLDRERIPVVSDGTNGTDGVPGQPGADGKVLYTWIRYADNVTGSGISNNPTGKKYIGFAYNKDTATESSNPSDYTWSLYHGEDGTDGIQGSKGADGKTLYTWIAYSDYADGRDMYQIPNSGTLYIGIAVNKETATESTDPSDYTWSLFKGEDGEDGKDGEDGENGKDANLLPWVEDWNGTATEINGSQVVTPRIFAGEKESSGQLTGVAIGRGIIYRYDENGNQLFDEGGNPLTRTGVFGVKDGELTFELDADTGEATFRGKVETSSNGDRIVIDPLSKAIQMIAADGKLLLDMSFYNEPEGSSINCIYYSYDTNGKQVGHTQIFGGNLDMWYNDINIFGVSYLEDKIYFRIDPSKLPTSASGTYYGGLYRVGNQLMIRAS